MLSPSCGLYLSLFTISLALPPIHARHIAAESVSAEAAVCLMFEEPPRDSISLADIEDPARIFEQLGAFTLRSTFETSHLLSQPDEGPIDIWGCSKNIPLTYFVREDYEAVIHRRLQNSGFLGGFLSPLSQVSPNFQVTEFFGHAKSFNDAVNRAAIQAQTLMQRYNDARKSNDGTGMLSVLESLGDMIVGTTTPAPAQSSPLDTIAGLLASSLPPDQAKRVSLVGNLFSAGISQANSLASAASRRSQSQNAIINANKPSTTDRALPALRAETERRVETNRAPVVLRASGIADRSPPALTRKLSSGIPKRVLLLGCRKSQTDSSVPRFLESVGADCLEPRNDPMTVADILKDINEAFGAKNYSVVGLLAWVEPSDSESITEQRNAARILRMALNRLVDSEQTVVVFSQQRASTSLSPCQIGANFLCLDVEENTLVVPDLLTQIIARDFEDSSREVVEQIAASRRLLLTLSASSFGNIVPLSTQLLGFSSFSESIEEEHPIPFKSAEFTPLAAESITSESITTNDLDIDCFFGDREFVGTLIISTLALDYIQCQESCNATPSCSYFSFSNVGHCSQYQDASGMRAVEGSISGPYSCSLPGATAVYDAKELELFNPGGNAASTKLTNLLENPPIHGNVGMLVGNSGGVANTATKVAEGASGFLDTASTLMATGQQFLKTFPISTLAKVGGSVAKDRGLKAAGGKKSAEGGKMSAGPPPASVGLPRVVCHVEGMTCCVPRKAVNDWQRNPPYLNNAATPGCNGMYVSQTDEMCVTTTYDGPDNCNMSVTETESSLVYDSTMVLPSRTMNDAQCQCASNNKQSSEPSFEPSASWIYAPNGAPEPLASSSANGLMATTQKLQQGVTAFSQLLSTNLERSGKTIQASGGVTGPMPLMQSESSLPVNVAESAPAPPAPEVVTFPAPANGNAASASAAAASPQQSVPRPVRGGRQNANAVQFTSQIPALTGASFTPTERPVTSLLGAATQLLQVASSLSRGVTGRTRLLQAANSCWVPWPRQCVATPSRCEESDCVTVSLITNGCPHSKLQFEVDSVSPGDIRFSTRPFAFGNGEPSDIVCDFIVVPCDEAAVEFRCNANDSNNSAPLEDGPLTHNHLHVSFNGEHDMLFEKLPQGRRLVAVGIEAIELAEGIDHDRVDLTSLAFQSRLRALVVAGHEHIVDLYQFPTTF